jgi:hypothetical protein
MAIVIEKNEMGGKSVYVGSTADLAKVPASHRQLVGETERLALADSARYFLKLAERAKRRALRQWLKMLAECKTCFLELHVASARKYPGFPPAAYLRFSLENESEPAVKLRNAQSPPETIASLTSVLAEVYELIDGINSYGYGMAGELLSAADITPFAGTGMWFSESNTVDPETCLLFYTSLNGDMLGFQAPDRAVWYAHEVGELQPAGSLRSLVNRYFRLLIQGEVLERE